jgi:uncharacterized protein (TIGR03382 family)
MSRAVRVAALLALAAAASLLPRATSACGGFYGTNVEVSPDQAIAVAHRAGQETYVFSPRFCGVASEFGVILPIPAPLSTAPVLGDAALFVELDRLSEPTTVEVCEPSGFSCMGATAGAAKDGPVDEDFGSGVDVVDQGRVGDFTFSVVQATTASAFTDWLTANGFPYDAALDPVYQSYVDQGWYFVAFKVTTDAGALLPGQRLCGDLGPLQLQFPSAAPYVPARITSVNEGGSLPRWRVWVVAAAQQRLTAASAFWTDLYFSGALAHAGLTDYPALRALSQDGERLTGITVRFPWGGAQTDLGFEDDPFPQDFRAELQVLRDCGGCEAGGSSTFLAWAVAGLAVLRARRRSGRRGAP